MQLWCQKAATAISPAPAISTPSAVQPIPAHAAPKSQQKGAVPINHNRKFNIVLFGVSECPKGTNRQTRQSSDLSSIATIISSLNTDVKPDSISDCFRLGKFDPKHHQPRPLLVSLICSANVQTILANHSKLSKPIVIKPHMSPKERFNESLLLKVRWKLIRQGVERKSNKGTWCKNLRQQQPCRTNIQLTFCIFFFMVTWASRFWQKCCSY